MGNPDSSENSAILNNIPCKRAKLDAQIPESSENVGEKDLISPCLQQLKTVTRLKDKFKYKNSVAQKLFARNVRTSPTSTNKKIQRKEIKLKVSPGKVSPVPKFRTKKESPVPVLEA